LWFDYLNTGDGWRQGDWLINFGSGLVRRGLIGEGFIWLSDLSQISLIVVVIATQAVLLSLLLCTFLLLWLLSSNRTVLAVLFASPAFCMFLWAGDVQGIMRKEILGYLALAVLTLASAVPQFWRPLPVFALLLYAVACIGNVMHSFMLPLFLIGFYILYRQKRISFQSFMAFSIAGAVLAVFWLTFGIRFNSIDSLERVCSPLLERGLTQSICEHAIYWLVSGQVDHIDQVMQRMTFAAILEFGLIAGLSVLPVGLACYMLTPARLVLLIMAVALVSVAPLYFVATDWGRWVSISYTCFALLLAQAHFASIVQGRTRVSPLIVVSLIVVPFLVTPDHTIGWKPGGVTASVYQMLKDVL
jgi:hypothetical protein